MSCFLPRLVDKRVETLKGECMRDAAPIRFVPGHVRAAHSGARILELHLKGGGQRSGLGKVVGQLNSVNASMLRGEDHPGHPFGC
mgnify:FL=1